MTARGPALSAVVLVLVLVLVLAACGGDRRSRCDALERRLAALVATDQARWADAGGQAARFAPTLDGAVTGELVARCRAGSLPEPLLRCALAAVTALDLDRCAARHDRD